VPSEFVLKTLKCRRTKGNDLNANKVHGSCSSSSSNHGMSGKETGLEPYVEQQVSIITNDGRNIVGVLKGFDQATNLILNDSYERVYSTEAGVDQLVLGLYIIRGDNIAVVGELDEEMDSNIDFDAVRAQPLKSIHH